MQEPASWEWQNQLEAERHHFTVEALERCLAAGAHPEDLEFLAREFGIAWRATDAGTVGVGG